MARIVKQEEHDLRRAKILDAAQSLLFTHGYDQMSIQDVIAALSISKGAFYHYFSSKQALLEALIERMAHQVIQVMLPIVRDESLPAPQKLQRVFDVASRWKTDRKDVLLTLANVWYADENAVLRLKAEAALLPLIAPLISTIICQGVEQGLFHTAYPHQVSQILFSLLHSFSDSLIPLILQHGSDPAALQHLETLSASHQDALERILGAEPGSLPIFDTTILREWFKLPNLPKE